MLKFLILLPILYIELFLFNSFASAQTIDTDLCKESMKKIEDHKNELLRLKNLHDKNNSLLEKYSDNSKIEMKIQSNLLIIDLKTQTTEKQIKDVENSIKENCKSQDKL